MIARAPGLILVSGLARCGTSLLMQMLSAGGWPVYGPDESTWPAFEHPIAMSGQSPTLSATGLIKWLIPVVPVPREFRPPKTVRGTIFLHRNPLEQARSHLKLMKYMGMPTGDVDAEAYGRTFARDAPLARAALARSGPVLDASFENLISMPRVVLADIQRFIGDPMDIDAAVKQLRPRKTGAACLPCLLEEEMVEEALRRE